MARHGQIALVAEGIFEERWGEVGKGRRLSTARHLARAAQGASPAVFKLIRTGGCSSRTQLTSQFTYLFSKSVDIHDSKGTYDHKRTLGPEQIEKAVSAWADDWKGRMNAARTTHMVMSFPKDTQPRHVSLIAGEICKEKFGDRFHYMIAVHADEPGKYPHAHIIVNRRGAEGDYFALRRGTEFTYEAFKEAMVDRAKRYGIQLEATTRLQRGLVNYPPTDGQWRKAKEAAAETGAVFEAPKGKARAGAALARAEQEVRDWSLRYRDLASFASASNMQDIANALEKSSQILAAGGVITEKGEPYMTVNEDFDRATSDLVKAVDRVEREIAAAAPNQRPQMERQLSEALAGIEHLQPLGAKSATLTQAASNEGIYSQQNTEAAANRIALEGREKLTAALDGTGIDPVEVEARLRAGASSAAIEARWTQQDVQSVAEMRGLDLRDAAQKEQAVDIVDAAYNKIARDYGIDDVIERRAEAAGTADPIEAYDTRFPNRDTSMADEVSYDARRAQTEADAELDAATEIAIQTNREQQAAAADEWYVERYTVVDRSENVVLATDDAREADDKWIGDPQAQEVRDQGRMVASINSQGEYMRTPVYEQQVQSARALAASHRELDATNWIAPASASIGSTEAERHELRQHANPVGADDERRLREAIERTLTSSELERLKRGDVDALRGVGTRDEQLTLARDYLRSTNDPTAQQGLDRVNEQLSAERQHARRERGHEGGGHE